MGQSTQSKVNKMASLIRSSRLTVSTFCHRSIAGWRLRSDTTSTGSVVKKRDGEGVVEYVSPNELVSIKWNKVTEQYVYVRTYAGSGCVLNF